MSAPFSQILQGALPKQEFTGWLSTGAIANQSEVRDSPWFQNAQRAWN